MSAVLPHDRLAPSSGSSMGADTSALKASTVQGPAPGEPSIGMGIDEPLPKSMTPLQRLELSRAKMKSAMLLPLKSAPDRSPALASSWLSRLAKLPGLEGVVDFAQTWWSQHPLRPIAMVVAGATQAAARPVAEKNPFAMVGVAALVGAALAWTRPWRWLIRSALFAGLVPQLASRIVAKLPIESWIAMLSTALKAPPPRPASAWPREAPPAGFDQKSF